MRYVPPRDINALDDVERESQMATEKVENFMAFVAIGCYWIFLFELQQVDGCTMYVISC